MKRITSAIAVILILAMVLSGCNDTSIEVDETQGTNSMFVEVETTFSYSVVYHRDTKVMYVVSTGYNNGGNFTLLVDVDGKPMLYENDDK